MACMGEKRARTSLAGVFAATTTACAIAGIWAVHPDDPVIAVTAVGCSFIASPLVPHPIISGVVAGTAAIIACANLVEPDPSGLGPPTAIFAIQFIVSIIPMVIAGWIGGIVREILSNSAPPRSATKP
jgi:hypothetical protein